MAEVMSQVLDYSKMKRQASESESTRQIISSSNGSTFTCGQVAEIQIAGNQIGGTFMDWQSSYLKLTVTNNDGAAISLADTGGAYNLISKIEVLSSGYTLSSIDNYNKLVCILSEMQLSPDYRNETGDLLAGMGYDETAGANIGGTSIAAGASKTFALPLHALPMTSSNRYWPLFARDNLRLRITFSSAANATIGAATDAEVSMSPVELVSTNVRLNQQSFAALNQMVGGKYTLVCSDYRNSTSSIAAASTTFVANTAFSHLSLDRVLFGFFGTENTALADSNGNRDFRNLQEYSFVINGSHVPARKIKVSATNGAEAFAELANCSNALVDVHHIGSSNRNANYLLEGGAGTQNDNTGHFLAGINCESVREHGAADSVYSGANTLGAVTQLEGTFSAAGDACNLQAFSNFTVMYTLDTMGNNTWVPIS